MTSRTGLQARYWTDEEHERFVEGLNRWGIKESRKIAQHVGTRSAVQVRTHAQKYFLKVRRHGTDDPAGSTWSTSEDRPNSTNVSSTSNRSQGSVSSEESSSTMASLSEGTSMRGKTSSSRPSSPSSSTSWGGTPGTGGRKAEGGGSGEGRSKKRKYHRRLCQSLCVH